MLIKLSNALYIKKDNIEKVSIIRDEDTARLVVTTIKGVDITVAKESITGNKQYFYAMCRLTGTAAIINAEVEYKTNVGIAFKVLLNCAFDDFDDKDEIENKLEAFKTASTVDELAQVRTEIDSLVAEYVDAVNAQVICEVG